MEQLEKLQRQQHLVLQHLVLTCWTWTAARTLRGCPTCDQSQGSDISKFQTKPFPLYDKLGDLYDGHIAEVRR
ncbi:hypothetical protein ZWY2020_033319 [Hordeum vulgare]|nr:hypothetical protein ZWY2020_033319 [Hordeum vulgare]